MRYTTYMNEQRYKLIVHVPRTHADRLRQALGEVGAGQVGNYDFCSFSYVGIGRFRPNEQAKPAIGVAGQIEQVEEESIEIVMSESILVQVINTLKLVHPYEEPAYEVYKLENF